MSENGDIRIRLNNRKYQQDRLKNNINTLLNQLNSLTDQEIEMLNTTLEKRFSKVKLEDLNENADKLFNEGIERE